SADNARIDTVRSKLDEQSVLRLAHTRLLRRTGRTRPVPAHLVAGRRGAVLSDLATTARRRPVAVDARRAGAHRTGCADAGRDARLRLVHASGADSSLLPDARAHPAILARRHHLLGDR